MSEAMDTESKGGPPQAREAILAGTANQVEWAAQIRANVNLEFDRVAKALERVSRKQTARDQMDTWALIAILEEKRAEVMARNEAGYFISEWRELSDQVRQMMARDARYQAIQAGRKARRELAGG